MKFAITRLLILTSVMAVSFPLLADTDNSQKRTPQDPVSIQPTTVAVNFFTTTQTSNTLQRASLPNLQRGNVLMYSTPGCFYCGQAKQYMKRHGISYREIDISVSRSAQREFFSRGGKGVPLIFVGTENGTHRIHGFNESQFASIYASR